MMREARCAVAWWVAGAVAAAVMVVVLVWLERVWR